MCGRFTLHTPKALLAGRFDVDLSHVGELAPHYNIAPSQFVLTLRRRGEERVPELLRWGLVPHWAKPLEKLPPLINARVETLATRPAYRDSLRRKRCLVLADGFYEWRSGGDRKAPKTPFWISLADGEPFGMAGLWAVWQPPAEPEAEPEAPVVSCTIVTGPANAAVSALHPRMPLILPRERAESWLDPGLDGQPERALECLVPVEAEALRSHPVSTRVNSPHADDAELIAPVDDPAPRLL